MGGPVGFSAISGSINTNDKKRPFRQKPCKNRHFRRNSAKKVLFLVEIVFHMYWKNKGGTICQIGVFIKTLLYKLESWFLLQPNAVNEEFLSPGMGTFGRLLSRVLCVWLICHQWLLKKYPSFDKNLAKIDISGFLLEVNHVSNFPEK